MRTPRSLGLLPLMLLVVCTALAAADPRVNKTAGLSVEYPKDWKVHVDAGSMFGSDPKEEAAVFFSVADAADLQKVGDAIEAQLAKLATDVAWGKPDKVKVNGLDAVAMKGTAKIDDKPVKTAAILLVSPTKKGVFLLGLVQADKEAAHRKELDTIAGSLRPAK
jgi:hypothetical protein